MDPPQPQLCALDGASKAWAKSHDIRYWFHWTKLEVSEIAFSGALKRAFSRLKQEIRKNNINKYLSASGKYTVPPMGLVTRWEQKTRGVWTNQLTPPDSKPESIEVHLYYMSSGTYLGAPYWKRLSSVGNFGWELYTYPKTLLGSWESDEFLGDIFLAFSSRALGNWSSYFSDGCFNQLDD